MSRIIWGVDTAPAPPRTVLRDHPMPASFSDNEFDEYAETHYPAQRICGGVEYDTMECHYPGGPDQCRYNPERPSN